MKLLIIAVSQKVVGSMESWLHITITCNFYLQIRGFSGGSDDKESACNAGDLNFDPWVGKIPWRRE